jgi:hypothetical protein
MPDEFAIGGAVFGIPSLSMNAPTPEQLRAEINRLRAALEEIALTCPQAAAQARNALYGKA